MTETAAPLPAGREPHICDVLIAERAPRLTRSALWPLARPFLYKLLNYRHAVRMADAVRPLSGAEALDYMSDLLDLKVSVMEFGIEVRNRKHLADVIRRVRRLGVVHGVERI